MALYVKGIFVRAEYLNYQKPKYIFTFESSLEIYDIDLYDQIMEYLINYYDNKLSIIPEDLRKKIEKAFFRTKKPVMLFLINDSDDLENLDQIDLSESDKVMNLTEILNDYL